MADSTKYRRSARALALCVGVLVATPVAGSDGVIRISAALFDKFAAALQPMSLQRTGWYSLRAATPFGPVDLPPVFCSANVSVSGVRLTVVQGAAWVTGSINGSMCGIGYSTTFFAPVVITIDASTSALLVRPVGPTNINASVNVLGVSLTVPFTDIDIAPALTVLAIPIDVIRIETDMPSGPRPLTLVSRNHQVSLRNGYVEIQADVHFR